MASGAATMKSDSGCTPSGSAGSARSTAAPPPCIGAARSIRASTASPRAALRAALFVVTYDAVELGALRCHVGKGGRQFAENLFIGGERRSRDARALLDAGAALRAHLGFGSERLALGSQARQRAFGIGRLLALALDVGAKLHQPAPQLGNALRGARFLALKGVAGVGEPRQHRGGVRFGFAKRRQGGRR